MIFDSSKKKLVIKDEFSHIPMMKRIPTLRSTVPVGNSTKPCFPLEHWNGSDFPVPTKFYLYIHLLRPMN